MTLEKGKTYFYEKYGRVKSGIFRGQTKAWLIFENGDYLHIWEPVFENESDLHIVNTIVDAMEKTTRVPDKVMFGRSF